MRNISMDDKIKYSIISRIQKDMEPKDIAEELGVPYASVLRVRTQYNEHVQNGTINQLIDLDKLMIADLADKFPVDEVEKLVKSVGGLEVLSAECQGLALEIIKKSRTMLTRADSMSELGEVTEILCKLQNAFFNKNSTQVNVQNNNFGGSANDNPYSSFLSDAPGRVVNQ